MTKSEMFEQVADGKVSADAAANTLLKSDELGNKVMSETATVNLSGGLRCQGSPALSRLYVLCQARNPR